MKKWVPGHPSIQVAYDGKTYYFPGEEQKQMFLAAPQKYVPALGGDCVVCQTEMGKRMPGSVLHAALSGNRLFLFPNEDMKKKFTSEPRKYAQADVALGGLCSVCRVEMNQDVAGDPQVSLIHGGMRYQFASNDQRNMFLANPSKYAVKGGVSKSIPGSTSKGSTTR
jgi:YHS domain-containing protein